MVINIIRRIHTEIKEAIVFLLVPFKKNKIMVLIIKHMKKVGIMGLNPHPTMMTKRNIKAKFK